MQGTGRKARVEHPADDRAVAVEVPGQQRSHPADRAVAALLVEEVVDQPAQGSVVAEESLKGSRQRAVLGRERLAQGHVQRRGRPVMRIVGAMHEAFELARDKVDIQRNAGIAQGDQADLEPPLDHRGAIDLRVVAHVGCKLRVVQGEIRDGDVVSLDAHVAAEVDGFYLPEHRFSSLRYPATDLERSASRRAATDACRGSEVHIARGLSLASLWPCRQAWILARSRSTDSARSHTVSSARLSSLAVGGSS